VVFNAILDELDQNLVRELREEALKSSGAISR
jgi:hypothetical protein